jgi:heat shock protein HtpX
MWFNQLKTVVLLAGLSGLLIVLGGLLGGYSGIVIAFIISLIMNGLAYFFSDTMILNMYKAQPLNKEQYGWLYNMVGELTQKSGLPMPKLWLVDTPMANAFATGRNPNHASVAVTTGILGTLNEQELRGVLAHEISHIKNRDILISSIAATMATAISFLANIMQNMAFWGTIAGNNDRRRGPNPLVLIVVAILMPIAATLIQLAISRSREYLADESGAEVSHDPLALASALEKLQAHTAYAHLRSDDTLKATTAHLFIVNPFTGQGLATLFSTHPPMQARIERLHALYRQMVQGSR